MPIFNAPEQSITEMQVAQIVEDRIAELPTPTGDGDGYTTLYSFASTSSNQLVNPITVNVAGYEEVIIDFALTAPGDVPNASTALPILTFNGDTGANYNVVAYTNDTGNTTYTGVNFIRIARIQGTGVFTGKASIKLAGQQNTVSTTSNMGLVNGSIRAGTLNGSWVPSTPVNVTSIFIEELYNNFYVGSNSTLTIRAK